MLNSPTIRSHYPRFQREEICEQISHFAEPYSTEPNIERELIYIYNMVRENGFAHVTDKTISLLQEYFQDGDEIWDFVLPMNF